MGFVLKIDSEEKVHEEVFEISESEKRDNANKKVNEDIANLKRQHLSIEQLLIFATEHDCSDLYIKVTDYPYISR